MNNAYRVVCAVAAVAVLMSLSAAQSSVTVTASNPLSILRQAETIEVPLAAVFNEAPRLRGAAIRVSPAGSSKPIPSQLIDENADGVLDLLIFQSDFKPREIKQFTVTGVKEPGTFPAVVDGRFVRPREDFAWENERIAFRMYGPALAAEVNSGIDVWCKRVRYPIVEKWYKGEELEPKVSYHTDHGEGADFFSVGKTLGAGGAGLLVDGKVRQPGVFTTYRVIANGPIRMAVELSYSTWNVAGRKFLETKRITLDAGSHLNRIDEWFVSNDTGRITIAAGLVKRANTALTRGADGSWMSLWGPTTTDPVNGDLGTAVIYPFQKDVGALGDSTQWLMTADHRPVGAFRYASGAAWTRSGDIASAGDWSAYVLSMVERFRHPMEVRVSVK